MIVIVVGMHCSGGSAVAALLQRHGVVMGDDERSDAPCPRALGAGRFENPRFRILNDRIAERQGYAFASFKPEIPVCRAGAITRLRMRRLIRSFDERYAAWGWKDPRCCVTLEAWLREIERIGRLEKTRIVYTVRDPDAVARSLTERTGIDPATALRLWKSYNERALSTIDVWRPPTHYVSREDLEEHGERATAALLRFLGRPASPDPPAAAAGLPVSAAPAEAEALARAVSKVKARISRRVRASLHGAAREAD